MWDILLDGNPLVSARRVNAFVVIAGGKESGPYDEVHFPFGYSTDPERIAYNARIGNAWYVETAKKRYGPYKDVPRWYLTDDADVKLGDKPIDIGSDGKDAQPSISPKAATPTRNELIVEDRGGKLYVRFGAFRGGPYDDFGYDEVYSPDGNAVSYTARVGRFSYDTVILDGIEYIGRIQGADIVYVKDGKILRLRAEQGGRDICCEP